MRKLTSKGVIAALSVVTLLFAAGTLDAGALDEPQQQRGQKQGKGKPAPVEDSPKECRDGLDNDGDGLIDADDPSCGGGGDGGGGVDPSYGVTLSDLGSTTAIGPVGPCNGPDDWCFNEATVDEDKTAQHNRKPNPARPYWTGAALVSPTSVNVTVVLSNLTTGETSTASRCTEFFIAGVDGFAHMADGSEDGQVEITGGTTVTWEGAAQVHVALALSDEEGAYGRKAPKNPPTWTGLDGAGREVKGRVTMPYLSWDFHYDDEWMPPDAARRETYEGYTAQADSGWLQGDADTNAGVASTWNLAVNGPVVLRSWGDDSDPALCNVNVQWQITRNP